MAASPLFEETIAPPPLAWAVLVALLLVPVGAMTVALVDDPRAAPVLAPVMAGVVLLLLVLVWPCRLSLERDGLHLRHGLFRHEVPVAALDPGAWRRLDLDQERALRPLWRTMGTGLPRFRGGWYRLRDRRRAFVLVNRWAPAWAFEPADGPVVLVTPARGEALMAAIARLHAERGADHRPSRQA